jgi:hypothetical protein
MSLLQTVALTDHMIHVGFDKHDVENIATHGSTANLSAGERSEDILGILFLATPLGPSQSFVGQYINFVKCSYERNFDAYNKDLQAYITKTHLPKRRVVLYTIDIMQKFMLPDAKRSPIPITHAFFERAIIFVESLSRMEVWFKNAIYGEIPTVGYDRTIENTGFPLHRYETIPIDVIAVKNAPLLYHMGHFNSFSDTDYGILSVANPTTFAFTVRMMTCLVVVKVTRDIMFVDISFSSNNNGPVTLIPKYPDDNVFGSRIVNDLKVSTLSFKVHMKGDVMVMMDMQTKYVYRFVS